jgi:hypothetical protein
MKEKLLAGCEHEIRATVYARQYLVLEFHVKRRSIPRALLVAETEMGTFGSPRQQDNTSPLKLPLDSAHHAIHPRGHCYKKFLPSK